MTESQLERWLGKRLKTLGCLYFKFISPGNDGMPDRIIITSHGRIIFAELKSESGKPSAIQRLRLGQLRRRRCDARLVVGLNDAMKLLEDISAPGDCTLEVSHEL